MSIVTAGSDVSQLSIAPFDGNSASWDRFVAESDDGTHCHLSAWRTLLADVFGLQPRYYVATDDAGQIAGLLPLVRMRTLRGHHLISLPFINYGGPIGSVSARRLLAKHAIDDARTSNAHHLELRAQDPVVEAGLSDGRPKVTSLLELPKTADQLWREGFSAKLRSQIRRPQKQGMMVRFGPREVTAFYEVFSRNMRDLGTPVQPRSFFERLIPTFGEQVVFGVVYEGDTPVAAGCGFVWRGEFEMNWASSLRAYNRHAPNMLLYWSFMETMIERGVRSFNFGRCTPGSSTHQFKKQWGGRDVPLAWAQWSRVPQPRIPARESRLAHLAPAVWRHLPLWAANRLGPTLARRIPAF